MNGYYYYLFHAYIFETCLKKNNEKILFLSDTLLFTIQTEHFMATKYDYILQLLHIL